MAKVKLEEATREQLYGLIAKQAGEIVRLNEQLTLTYKKVAHDCVGKRCDLCGG